MVLDNANENLTWRRYTFLGSIETALALNIVVYQLIADYMMS
jgi:hypothetical protein